MRVVDNSDKAIIAKACRLVVPGMRVVHVVYDDFEFQMKRMEEELSGEACAKELYSYFATVEFDVKDGHPVKSSGHIIRKPTDLKNKPNDPLVKYLLSTGATP